MSLAANLELEAEGSPGVDETYLEKGILRNKKTFEAVFDRIYEKYERDFHEDEDGGNVINLVGHDSESQIDYIFGNENSKMGSKYRPILITNVSESDSEDPDLAALLHERVIRVKKEIDWDNEELKLQEQRKREIEQYQSSDESESEYSVAREQERRRGYQVWCSKSDIGRTSVSVARFKDDDSLLSLPIDPCSSFGEEHANISDNSSKIESEYDSPNDEDSVSTHKNISKLLLDESGQSVCDTTCTYTVGSETKGICNATTTVISSESVSDSGNNDEVSLSRQPHCQSRLPPVRKRDTFTPESRSSSCSASPLLMSINLANVKLTRSKICSGQLSSKTDRGTALRRKGTARRGRPFMPMSKFKFVSDVKSEPESLSESQAESESDLEPSPGSSSQVEFNDDKCDELLSGYESGYVEEPRDQIPGHARTPPVSPVRLPPPSNNHTESGSSSSAGQSVDSGTTFQIDSQGIATSTPVIVKMKSLQLSLTKAPLRTPLKDPLFTAQMTNSLLSTPPKEQPSSGHMTNHIDLYNPQKQPFSGHMTNPVILDCSSKLPLSGHMTDSVILDSPNELPSSGHMMNFGKHKSSNDPPLSGNMTDAVYSSPHRGHPSKSHMTESVYHTPPSRELPQPTDSTNYSLRKRRVLTIIRSRSKSTGSLCVPSNGHLSNSADHTICGRRQSTSGHVTKSPIRSPPPACEQHLLTYYMTDSSVGTPPETPSPSDHMTNSTLRSLPRESPSASHITKSAVHTNPRTPSSSGHMTNSTHHNPPMETPSASHMTNSSGNTSVTEAQTQTDDISMSSDSSTERFVTSTSYDSVTGKICVAETTAEQKSKIHVRPQQHGHIASCYPRGQVHAVTNDVINTNRYFISPQQSFDGVCHHHHHQQQHCVLSNTSPPCSCNCSSCHHQHHCHHAQSTVSPQRPQNSGDSQVNGGNHTHIVSSCPSHSHDTSPGPGCSTSAVLPHGQEENHTYCVSSCPSHSHDTSPGPGCSTSAVLPHGQEENHTYCVSSCPSHSHMTIPNHSGSQTRQVNHTHAMSCPSHSQIHTHSPCRQVQGTNHTHTCLSRHDLTQPPSQAHTISTSCPTHSQIQSTLPQQLQQNPVPPYPTHIPNPSHMPVHKDYPHTYTLSKHSQVQSSPALRLQGNSTHQSHDLSDNTTPTRPAVPPSPSHNLDTFHVSPQSHVHVQGGNHTHNMPPSPSHNWSVDHPSPQSHVGGGGHAHNIPPSSSHHWSAGHPSPQSHVQNVRGGSHVHAVPPSPSHNLGASHVTVQGGSRTHAEPPSPSHFSIPSSPNSCNNGQVYGGSHTHRSPSHSQSSSAPHAQHRGNHTHNLQSCPSHFSSPVSSHNHNHNDASSTQVHSVNHTYSMLSYPSHSLNPGQIPQVKEVSHTHSVQSSPSHSDIPRQGHDLNNTQMDGGSHTHTMQSCPTHSDIPPSPTHPTFPCTSRHTSYCSSCTCHAPLHGADTIPHTSPSHHASTYKRAREEEGEKEMCYATEPSFPPAKRHCY